jgi:hypothetical protein
MEFGLEHLDLHCVFSKSGLSRFLPPCVRFFGQAGFQESFPAAWPEQSRLVILARSRPDVKDPLNRLRPEWVFAKRPGSVDFGKESVVKVVWLAALVPIAGLGFRIAFC